MIRYRGNNYNEAYVEGDDVQLISIIETIIFPDLAKRIRKDAETDFYITQRSAGWRLNDFISNYFDETIENYLEAEKESAQVIKHCVN